LRQRQRGRRPDRRAPVGVPARPAADWHLVLYLPCHLISRGRLPARRIGAEEPGPRGTYLLLFPQLIAGPTIRYRYIADQLAQCVVSLDDFAAGVRRFVIGLGKKVLIANTVAAPAGRIFSIPIAELTPAHAWLGIICYTLQIYFDFSGYSDMAVGLSRMFGFHFPENFRWPYVADTVQEFWRRWHISLSSWFRDYLYVPLGGSRVAPARMYANLVTVFFLCGLWHGASWNFVIWGLFHGSFLVIERLGLAAVIRRLWPPLRHAYLLLVVMIGWVFFRADTLPSAVAFLMAMTGRPALVQTPYEVQWYLTPALWLALLAGTIGSLPVGPALARWRDRTIDRAPGAALRWGFTAAGTGVLGRATGCLDRPDCRPHLQSVHLLPVLMTNSSSCPPRAHACPGELANRCAVPVDQPTESMQRIAPAAH
jgi:alginate O-acetyltransferase complex protein AlgI